MKRIAFYGGSFDPVHRGHLKIASELTKVFDLDEFVFIPAFHAPHKTRSKPTSAYHRFAMLCLATRNDTGVSVSRIELEVPEKPYTIETLTKIKNELPNDRIFFVMGADSWDEITTWKEWENVLSIVNIIVVTRPGHKIGFTHVTDKIRERIIDLRIKTVPEAVATGSKDDEKPQIFITDAVQLGISSTKIRQSVRDGNSDWKELVSNSTAKHIEKYGLYQ
ncbi:MAG: nicotinate (nicotinamide) nucleotide adenylyltransferase [Pyrinomonadaceae bacterium]|nr:nicotinate (nicotinamide) nucleotide adenylyltransferase [Pyrinomonadaceae bacterium]